MQEGQHHKRLVERYLDNTATEEELQLFFRLLAENKLDVYFEKANESTLPSAASPPVSRRLFAGYGIAASVLLILGISAFFYVTRKQPAAKAAEIASTLNPDAKPGGKKAILTLEDGKQLILNAPLSQTLINGDVNISTKDNVLVYDVLNQSAKGAVNMITTPKGGEYQVKLPDGSVVWLNAGTSLKYPTAFTGKERVVELDGEAYFEIARNAAKPFIVKSNQGQVKVLGTHFNVRAYKEEGIMKTTLAEGSVLLQQNGLEEKLKPGQTGTVTNNATGIDVQSTNVQQDLAWKEGLFYFDKTPLAEIMTQLGRWYDLDIQYNGKVPDKRFVGKINRNANLAEVLNILRLSDIRFSMTGRTLMVEG